MRITGATGIEIAAWVGVGITAITLIVIILVAYSQRRRRVLAYKVFTEWPVVSRAVSGSRLQLVVDDRVLEDPHQLLFIVRSAGNETVLPDHVYRPLTVSFEDAELVDAVVQPTSGAPEVRFHLPAPNTIEFEPFLLNPTEAFLFTGLLEGCPHQLLVGGRLAGVALRDETGQTTVPGALLAAFTPIARIKLLGITISFERSRDEPEAFGHRVPTHRRHS